MLWTLLTAFALAGVRGATAATNAGPTACVSFDIHWNLLAFGFNGKDYDVGAQATWTDTSALTEITAQGRPPFDSPNARCFLSQFTNAIYVLNADQAHPDSIYIYDATAKSWTTQSVTAGQFDSTDYDAILDHDTNVFYAYSKASMFSLDMQSMKAANASALPWTLVQSPDLSSGTSAAAPQTPGANTAGYEPTLALAQNHIHFLGVPGLAPGSAKIFVIHFSFMQPAPQSYGNFPDTHGKAASFFLDNGVQQEFAFIPDDASATYVINVETNTTKTLTAPPKQDPLASYYASTSALVQLTSGGAVAFLPYDPKATTSGGTWSTISKIPVATAASPSASGNASAGASGSTTKTGASASATSGTAPTGGSNSTQQSAAGVAGVLVGGQSLRGAAIAVGLAVLGVLAL